jgi:ATP-binding cassette, subfamily B, bacterial
MVPQDGSLFEGTIAENVAMGLADRHHAEDHTPEELIELAFIELGLADWLDELPDGLETQVGRAWHALSAGERQLVALARAYIANPDLLVLDEATSAVDPATEVRLQRALVGLTQGRTTVTIAHRCRPPRPPTRCSCSTRARSSSVGSHDELVDAGGVYGRLHESWRTGQAA